MGTAQEYRTHVTDVVHQSPRAVSVRFERPPGFSYLAGQFMFIELKAGMETLTRHLTISSSPTEPFLEVTKGLTGHPFADALTALVPGDEATIRGPSGSFTLDARDEDVVFISGGIGVTPLRSMARYAADTRLLIRITLLYSARAEEEILFGEEFDELQRTNPLFSAHVTVTQPAPGWTGHVGRIDRAFVEKEVPDVRGRGFYVSGPAAMVDAMLAILREIGVPDDRVRHEYFPGY
ncbi:MAG TPA: FAD-dependent oxidoreductase [Methanoregulaceae archaeon]|nr:FAD-dependent oxidoreductase [Methanoregulaceae archaeon]